MRIDAEGFRNRRAYWITESPEVMDCYGRAIALVEPWSWLPLLFDMGGEGKAKGNQGHLEIFFFFGGGLLVISE